MKMKMCKIYYEEGDVMLHTDPASHASLVLVKAFDLGQVRGGGALHLETLLGEHTQRCESNCHL